MQFKGHLLLPDEPGPGLRVNLDVAEHHLAVESDGGGLGAWPLEVVGVERLHGDLFALTVADEQLQFIADDAISFAYAGVPTIERVSRRPRKTRNRLGIRSVFDRIWNGPDESTSSVTSEPQDHEEAPRSTVVEDHLPVPMADLIPEAVEEGLPEATSEQTPERAGMPLVEVDDMVDVPEESIPWSQTDLAESSPVDEKTSEAARCPGMRSDGRRCESAILTSSGYCYSHDPRRAFEDKYRAAQEARAQLRRDATERLNRIYRRLDKAVRQVERGDLDPETAVAMAQLASTMCAILGLDESAGHERR